MLQAIENINDFYKNIHIDFIHQAISLPGVTMRVCFNSITDPAIEFHLFNSKNKEIYQLFKENIAGGPSIIFNRYHEAGKIFIRNNPNKPCQKIIGYDANASYLWAIGQNFPAGCPLIRRQEKYFMREFPQFATGCRDWIDWLIHERNLSFSLRFMVEKEKLVLIELMVSVQSWTLCLNFMVIIGMPTLISFPTKTHFTLLLKIKMEIC